MLVRRGTIEGPAAAMRDGCAGRGDESLGLFERRDDRRQRRAAGGSLIAVHLFGGENGRSACLEAGCRLGVTGFRIGGDLERLVENHEGGFLTLAHLSAGLDPLPVSAPELRLKSRSRRRSPRGRGR